MLFVLSAEQIAEDFTLANFYEVNPASQLAVFASIALAWRTTYFYPDRRISAITTI